MALYGMSVAVCGLLVQKYPDGYTIEELFEEARGADPRICSILFLERTILGIEDGAPRKGAHVACWEMREDGRIYFDPQAKDYSSLDDYMDGTPFKDLVRERFLGRISNRPRDGD